MDIYSLMAAMPFLLILSHIVIYFIAKSLNKKHLWNYPEYKSYIWGYFQGIGVIFYSILGFIFCFLTLFLYNNAEALNATLWGLVASTLGLFVGYFVCCKEKWAFVLLTIFTPNPIIWIINYLYITRRPYLAKNYYHYSKEKPEKTINDRALDEKDETKYTKVESSNNNIDSIAQLEKIKKLLDDGAVTVVEYEKLKQKIMSKL
jgi:hypothetical protein